MRAVVVREFGGIENASLGEVPKPVPKAGEVLLETHAVSVNFVDLVMMSGSYQFKPKLPFVPGKLPVGVVAAVGDGVKSFKVGDRALMMAEAGGFAEFCALTESQCIKIPASLSFTEAAAMALVYDTAWVSSSTSPVLGTGFGTSPRPAFSMPPNSRTTTARMTI